MMLVSCQVYLVKVPSGSASLRMNATVELGSRFFRDPDEIRCWEYVEEDLRYVEHQGFWAACYVIKERTSTRLVYETISVCMMIPYNRI